MGEKVKPPKYRVGEYITRDPWVILQISAVVPGIDNNAIYGITSLEDTGTQWLTEFELDELSCYSIKPDLAKWEKIKEGDMVHMGVTSDRQYVKVLARVGDLVMLSDKPIAKKERDSFDKLASQIEQLTDGIVTKDEIKTKVRMPNTHNAHKSTMGEWFSIERLSRMHWELLSTESEE